MSDHDDGARSLEAEARSAFRSPSQLAAQRLGRARTPLSRPTTPSCGGSVGGQSRRSASLIQTQEDEDVFAQIGDATAIRVAGRPSAAAAAVRPEEAPLLSPIAAFMEGRFAMEDVLQGPNMGELFRGANAAAENLMRSLAPAGFGGGGDDDDGRLDELNSQAGLLSLTSYGNQTVGTTQRSPLDLHHNDNSFHVLANLVLDFLQTKLTPTGTAIVLHPEDRVRMERLLPEALRLDFLDAVAHRLDQLPPVAATSLDRLTLRCRALGLDREGSANPVLAAANLADEPLYIPLDAGAGGDRPGVMNAISEESENRYSIASKESLESRLSLADAGAGLPQSELSKDAPDSAPIEQLKSDDMLGPHDEVEQSKAPNSLEMIANHVLQQQNGSYDSLAATETDLPHASSAISNGGEGFMNVAPLMGLCQGACGAEVPSSPTNLADLQRQKEQLSLSLQHTFSGSLVVSPVNSLQKDEELASEESKILLKEQLHAEISEARALIAQSQNPETAAFWEEHVAELTRRLQALDGETDGINGANALVEESLKRKMDPVVHPTASMLLETMKSEEYQPPDENFSIDEPLPPIKPKEAQLPAATDLNKTWNEEPSYHVPMVDVVAPADLPGGYHFEAELEGVRFLATVPAGGVKQGETFTSYMRELDSVAIDIPVGYWKDSMANVCEYGCCHPVFWNPIVCPLTSLWQIQTRIGLDFLGRPLEEGIPPPSLPNRTTLLTVLFSWFFMNCALLAGYNYKWSRGLDLSIADICALGVVNVSMFAFLVFITQSTRSSVREKFMIREQGCDDLEDVYVSTFALPCTIAQMSRHTANYDDYEAVCCSKTGLPDGVRVNQHKMSSESACASADAKFDAEYVAPTVV